MGDTILKAQLCHYFITVACAGVGVGKLSQLLIGESWRKI